MFKLKQVFMQEEGGEGGNGGGGQGPEITPEIQKLIDEAVGAAVGGLKSKNTELLGKLKDAGDKLKSFDGIDPDAVKSILQRFSDDEEAKLIAGGKIDEVLNKRTERMKSAFEKDVLTERQAREAAEQRASKFTKRVLENSIRAEASAAGLHQHAIDDALFRAGTTFQLDEEGNPVAVEGAFGKDGKPLTLKEWFADMKEKAPHWWPVTVNGGGSGHGGGQGGQSGNRSKMSPKEKAAFITKHGKDAFLALPE
ncbi:hypothetical protein D9M71_33950 [compost metagenome]